MFPPREANHDRDGRLEARGYDNHDPTGRVPMHGGAEEAAPNHGANVINTPIPRPGLWVPPRGKQIVVGDKVNKCRRHGRSRQFLTAALARHDDLRTTHARE